MPTLTVERAPAENVYYAMLYSGEKRLRDDGLVKAASGITIIEAVLKNVV